MFLSVEYAGYIIPVNSMKRWLFWIYYLNPVAYGESLDTTLTNMSSYLLHLSLARRYGERV